MTNTITIPRAWLEGLKKLFTKPDHRPRCPRCNSVLERISGRSRQNDTLYGWSNGWYLACKEHKMAWGAELFNSTEE